MKKTISILLAAVLLLSALAGCASTSSQQQSTQTETEPAEKTVIITVSHNMNEDPAINWLNACAEAFNKIHPEINVEFDCLSGDDYTTILKTKASADDMPDIFMVEDIWRNMDFAETGWCEDVAGYDWFRKNIQETAVNAVTTEDGKAYCVPMTVNGQFVTYNKDVFAAAGVTELPTTWSAFLAACQAIQDYGVTPIAAGYQEQWVLYCDEMCDSIVTTVKNDRNNRLELADGTTTWTEDKGHFSEVLRRMRERYAYTNDDPFGTDWNTVLNMMAVGDAAMILNGSWTPASVKGINPDANIGVFPLPLTEDPADALLPVHASPSGWCVNAESENKEAALAFAEFLSTSEAGSLMQSIKGEISANKNCAVAEDSDLYEIVKYINEGKTFDYTNYSELFLSDELEKILTDTETEFLLDSSMSVETALELLDARFAAALASGN